MNWVNFIDEVVKPVFQMNFRYTRDKVGSVMINQVYRLIVQGFGIKPIFYRRQT